VKPALQFVAGVGLLCAGHVAVALVASAFASEPVLLWRAPLVFLGAVQLLYAVPLLIALRRRKPVSAGITAAALLTLALNVAGLMG
jgi:hypothetical protein